jgi:hypothetical protein
MPLNVHHIENEVAQFPEGSCDSPEGRILQNNPSVYSQGI